MKFACCDSTAEGATGGVRVCSKCKNNYHIACLYPSDKKKRSPVEVKKNWLCPECSLSQPRELNNDNTPLRASTERVIRQSPENVTLRRGGAITNVPTSPTVCLLTKTAVSYDQYETLYKKVDAIESDYKSLKAINTDVGDLKTNINKLELDNNRREQWSRRSNLEIYGIPERKSENLLVLLKDIAQRIDFLLNIDCDLDFITRVAPREKNLKKPKPIVVRFLARYKKDEFLSKAKKSKMIASDLGFNNSNAQIFFNDHLTGANKSLLQRAKIIAKEHNFKYTWVKNCAIMVRRSDTSPVVHITNPIDLNKIK
ncbi:unnamed protein product [Euphydryas editha]|uniref:Zinc finger PHD-type domain-containing protein n=1 Tax=Euphydryas editha TaxID=104508 RepID=A0AAU9URD0_EUPED|nr:unnamed protein product [Euphydryas editha]